ncbi:MAG: PAS domain S-box protein, partial [Bacteroidota bacterium]
VGRRITQPRSDVQVVVGQLIHFHYILLGYSTANYLVLVPLITNEEVYGMFEIGSFSPLHQYQVDFLKGLAETVAAAINTVKVNDNTRRLLNESQELTEQMRAQEEEMRQNMEELQATQEEMKRGADDAEAKVHRLNTILNSTSDPLITVTSNGIIDAFNYAAESLFGYNASEVVDHNIGVILPEEKVVRRELVETSNNPIERARVITRRRMEGIRKGGKRFLAEVAIKDTFYDGQKYFTVQVRDISAEEERVSSLEQSNRKLKLELEAANSESNRADRSEREMRLRHLALDRSTLLMDLSADGKITHVNELAEKALELASEELEGKSFKEVLAALNDSEAFSYFWKQVLESQVILKQDLQLVGAANKTVWTHSAFAKVLDEKGELVKVLVIAQDISTQMFQLSETKAQIAELQNAQPEGAGEAVSEEMQQRLNELRELQTKIGDDLSQVMQANEERLREAIDLKERSFRK